MSQQFIVRNEQGHERPVDTRAEAESVKEDMEELGATVEIIPPGHAENPKPAETDDAHQPTPPVKQSVSDGGETTVEATGDTETPAQTADALDKLGEELGTDPLSILPGHMVDTIQGQPAVNKRGYAMIAERYGIEAHADVVVFPWENEQERAVAHATATTEDGREYSGWATASAFDGDMEEQIVELAETRALKRAVSWASGVGIVSYQEMVGELE